MSEKAKSDNPLLRAEAALEGRDEDLDELVSDPDVTVRMNVALRGRDKDLEKLIDDPDWRVREEVQLSMILKTDWPVKSICHVTPDVSQDISQNVPQNVIQLKAWKQDN